jgi:hypothetical protein
MYQGQRSEYSPAEMCFPNVRELESLARDMSAEDCWLSPQKIYETERADFERAVEMTDPEEADMLEMYNNGVTEAEIGREFGLSQAGVSYRLHRAHERIKFLLSVPHVFAINEHTIREHLSDICSAIQVASMAVYSNSWNYCRTGKVLGIAPEVAQHRIKAGHRALKRSTLPRAKPYREYFGALLGRPFRPARQAQRTAAKRKSQLDLTPSEWKGFK